MHIYLMYKKMEQVEELLKNAQDPLCTRTISRRLKMNKRKVTYYVTNNPKIYKVKPIYVGSGKCKLSIWEYGNKNRDLYNDHIGKPTMLITPVES